MTSPESWFDKMRDVVNRTKPFEEVGLDQNQKNQQKQKGESSSKFRSKGVRTENAGGWMHHYDDWQRRREKDYDEATSPLEHNEIDEGEQS